MGKPWFILKECVFLLRQNHTSVETFVTLVAAENPGISNWESDMMSRCDLGLNYASKLKRAVMIKNKIVNLFIEASTLFGCWQIPKFFNLRKIFVTYATFSICQFDIPLYFPIKRGTPPLEIQWIPNTREIDDIIDEYIHH